jgi:glycosyltransferase involved in cell wall biosynthesis
VLGDIPSLRELWDDAAEFVPPDDHQALQRALSALIASPERRTEFAARALARAQQFSSERMADAYVTAYAAAARATRFVESDSVSSLA